MMEFYCSFSNKRLFDIHTKIRTVQFLVLPYGEGSRLTPCKCHLVQIYVVDVDSHLYI